jgi:gustatory receptor
VVRTLEGRFEEAVIAYLFIVNLLPCIMIPILWSEIGKVATVLNSWSEFERLYSKVAGRELGLKLRTKSLVVAILLPILSTASVIVTHITMIHFRIEHVIPYIFLDTLIYMMGAYWYFVCQILSQAASILAEDFQRVCAASGKYLHSS